MPTVIRTGGYDNYSIRSATLIEGYFPGPGRTNLLQDPNLAIGKIDFGTFGGDDLIQNGPGTILQALPDASRFQYDRIFAVPQGNPYRNFGVDDRQIASYQVEQLQNNPLCPSTTTNPNGVIPGFECLEEPDNFSNMVNKRESEYKKYFEGPGNYPNNYLQGTTGGQNVYEQYSGKPVNPHAEVVYNMSMDYAGDVNPMIALGSSSRATSQPQFSGKCYSGNFVPGQVLNAITEGGQNAPTVYRGSYTEPNFEGALGFQNSGAYNNKSICVPDRSLSFANPLILNSFN